MTRSALFRTTALLAASVLTPSAFSGADGAFGASAAATTVLVRDEAEVAGIFKDCKAFDPSGCPFTVASTSDGSGQRLYAVDLERYAGDSCANGVTYFFHGRMLLTNTALVSPRAGVALPGTAGGKPVLAADGTKHFMVRFEVNPSKLALCAAYGSAGSDAYVYGFNGSEMVVLSGKAPRPPHVLAPTIRPSHG